MNVDGEGNGPQKDEEPDRGYDGVDGDVDQREPATVPLFPEPVIAEWNSQSWTEPPADPSASAIGSSPRRARAAVAAIVAGLLLLSAGIGIGWGLTRSQNGGSRLTEAPLTIDGGSSPGRGQTLTAQA